MQDNCSVIIEDGLVRYSKREQFQLFLTFTSAGLVGAELFELSMEESGEIVESFLVGSGSSTVRICEELEFYDVLFYVKRGHSHEVVSVNAAIAEYNRFIEQDFM